MRSEKLLGESGFSALPSHQTLQATYKSLTLLSLSVLNLNITSRGQKVYDVVDLHDYAREVFSGSITDSETIIIVQQAAESLQTPEEDALTLGNQFI